MIGRHRALMYGILSIFHGCPLTSIAQCLARKVPELCQPYTPGKTDQDLSARLSRLEHIIEMALPQYCTSNATTPSASNHAGHIETRRSSSVGDDDVHSQADEQDSIGGTFHSGRWFGNSASGSLAPAPVLELVCKCTSAITGSD